MKQIEITDAQLKTVLKVRGITAYPMEQNLVMYKAGTRLEVSYRIKNPPESSDWTHDVSFTVEEDGTQNNMRIDRR